MPLSKQDANQVLQYSYDPNQEAIKTTISGGTLVINAAEDSVAIGDGTNLVTTTIVGPDVGLDVNVVGGVVSGNFTTSGLSLAIKVSVITITDTPTKVPSVPLDQRNSMSVRVWTPSAPTSVVYFGDSTVSSTTGYPKNHGEEIILDIKDNTSVELYAVCETGKTAILRILELA